MMLVLKLIFHFSPMVLDSPSPSARYRPEISWIQIVYNEIVSVTNAMKRNQRWTNSTEEAKGLPLTNKSPFKGNIFLMEFDKR
jgi:hypothetical protein